jgi:hypothetical protein
VGKKEPLGREWNKKGRQAHMAAGASEASPKIVKALNQDEIEQLRSFLSRLEKPTGTSSLAYSGTFPSFLGDFPFSFGLNASDIPFKQYWILESGATQHMTPLPTHFSIYSPCPMINSFLM